MQSQYIKDLRSPDEESLYTPKFHILYIIPNYVTMNGIGKDGVKSLFLFIVHYYHSTII